MVAYMRVLERTGVAVLSCSRFLSIGFFRNEKCTCSLEHNLKNDGNSYRYYGVLVGIGLWSGVLCEGNNDGGNNLETKGMIAPIQWRKRQFLKYERRLRERSPPHKVFNYFANHANHEGERVMNELDVMRSLYGVLPPPGSSSIRSGGFEGEEIISSSHDHSSESTLLSKISKSEIFTLRKISKADGRSGISLIEWLLIDVLISYPSKHLWILFKMIDADCNGLISKEELLMLLKTLLGSSCLKHNSADFEKTVSNVQLVICESDGIDLEGFTSFCKELERDVMFIHYLYYTDESMQVTGYNLALSMVAAFVSIDRVDACLDKLQHMPTELRDMHVCFGNFQAICELIRGVDSVIIACNVYNRITNTRSIDMNAFKKIMMQIKGEAWYRAHSSMVEILFFICSENNVEMHVEDLTGTFLDQTYASSPEFTLSSKLQCALQCLRRT